MNRRVLCPALALAAVLLTAFLASAVPARATEPFKVEAVKVHFVVVPGVVEGRDVAPEIEALKAEFLRLAGGYTELGPTAGAAVGDPEHFDGANRSFLVAADHDLCPEIRTFVIEHFGKPPFLLVWDAERR